MNEATTPGTVRVEKTEQAIIVHVQAKMLDEKNLGLLQEAIDAPDGESAPPIVVIDLAQVQLVPSLCLGVLVQISAKCKARKQKVKFAAMLPQVRKVFTITHLDRVLELADTVDAALKTQ